MKKTITTALAVTLLATIAVAQEKPAAAAEQNDPIVVAAGDVTIRQSEFESALESLPAEYQQFAMGAGKKQFAEDYLRMKMLAAEGFKNGLDKSPEVKQQLNLMRENLVANAQLERIESGITISDEELKKQYDAKKDEYETVSAKHILIAPKGSPAAQAGKPELTKEQAKAKAEELRTQIVGGASFEEVAKKESDDVGSGARGGDLGQFGRGQMVKEFEDAAFSGKVGEVTPVIETQFGYHIIKVEARQLTPFEEVKPALERQERQKRLQAAIEKMKEDAKPTFNEAYFAPAPSAPSAQPVPPGTEQQ